MSRTALMDVPKGFVPNYPPNQELIGNTRLAKLMRKSAGTRSGRPRQVPSPINVVWLHQISCEQFERSTYFRSKVEVLLTVSFLTPIYWPDFPNRASHAELL